MPALRRRPCGSPHSRTTRAGDPRRSAGFTMVEVLAVVIVLGILSGIAVPTYLQHRTKSRVAAAASDARNTGAMIEESWAKDRRYPASPSEVSGWRLSDHNEIARYEVDNTAPNTGFAVCVVYKDSSASAAKAYAVYDSRKGGVIGKGSGDGGTLCTPNQSTPPAPADGTGGSTGGGGTGGGGGGGSAGGGGSTGGGGSSSLAAPANLTVDTVPGTAKATLNWQGVDGADGYAVFLDGATTAIWSGMATNTELTGLSAGAHEVVVKATKGADKSDPSQPALFSIYGDNDFVRNAHPVTVTGPAATWTSRDYTNQSATLEADEPNDLGAPRSMWWTYTANASGTVRVSLIAATDGTGPFPYPGIYAWQSSATTVSGVQTGPKWGTYRTTTITFPALKGQTYKIRVGATYSDPGKYRVKFETGPANDNVEEATTAPAISANNSWTSPDQNNDLAGDQTGENTSENGSKRGMWWTYTPITSGTVRVTIIAASNGSGPYPNGGIHVWRTTATDIASVQTAPKLAAGYNNSTQTFNAVKGETYKIRVGNTYSDVGNFRVRLETSPPNDNVAEATEVGSLSTGQSYTSPDNSNDVADREPGEDTGLGSARSLWWTYTPATSGTVRVSVLAAADGTTLPNPGIYAWDSTATTAAQVQTGTRYGDWGTASVTFAVTAGKTYKIRVGNTYGYVGKYRVKVDAL